MTPERVLVIGHDALLTMLLLASPLLIVALVVGLAIGIVQAATQINEMTLAFIPKLLAMSLTMVIGTSTPVAAAGIVTLAGPV